MRDNGIKLSSFNAKKRKRSVLIQHFNCIQLLLPTQQVITYMNEITLITKKERKKERKRESYEPLPSTEKQDGCWIV